MLISIWTGDVGYYDDSGYIYVLNKIKDVVKCKGVLVRTLHIFPFIFQSYFFIINSQKVVLYVRTARWRFKNHKFSKKKLLDK